MASALAIVLVMAAGELEDPSARAIGPALMTTARQDVALTVRESSRVPDEGDVARVAAAEHASLVIEVAWDSPARERALVHLHDAEGALIASTVLAFRESESQSERGRAIGFAVGTMLPSPAIVTTAMAIPGEPRATAPPEEANASKELPHADDADRPGSAPPRAPTEAPRPLFAVGAGAVAVTNLSGGPSGIGGTGHVQLAISETFALRGGALARTYSIDAGTSTEVGPLAGISWRMLRIGALSLTARLDALVLRNAYGWTNPAGKTADRSSWIVGGAAAMEACLRIARPFEAYLAPSIEIADRALADSNVVRSSPAWASLELGARFSF